MRLIDADVLFDSAFKVWGTEADGGETNLFMEMINNAPTIAPPPNEPLTLEQLLEMDGEPVWIVNFHIKKKDGFCDEWALVSVRRKDTESVGTIYHFENYGDYWLAYRRKPEETAI